MATTHLTHINTHNFGFSNLLIPHKQLKTSYGDIKIPRLLKGGGSTYTKTKKRRQNAFVIYRYCPYLANPINKGCLFGFFIPILNSHRLILKILVIKLLKHETVLKPFFIALSNDLRFHALYGDASVGSSNSVGGAIASIPNKYLYGVSDNTMDWERINSEPPMPTNLSHNA